MLARCRSQKPLASPPERMLLSNGASRPRAARRMAWTRCASACQACGSLVDVVYDWNRLGPPDVARFLRAKMVPPIRALVLQRRVAILRAIAVRPAIDVVTIGEGQTLLQPSAGVGKYVGLGPAGCFCNTRG